MLLTRLYLRNFRVYEDEVELLLPPGLIGIYGPNGSGKSTLLEAVLFTLWGKARTTKDQVRSAGVGGECVTEVEFEHEGHLYVVRRRLRGVASSVTVEVECDRVLMSSGTRDAERYIESVLGMDDMAFRASVFAEQKQLSAFSDHSPSERRKLVLGLLGVTPLDAARDAARRDAREKGALHERARGLLVDLDALGVEVEDAEVRAAAAEARAASEEQAATSAVERADAAAAALALVDLDRQAYENLVEKGKSARQALDEISLGIDSKRVELDELDEAAGALAGLEAEAAGCRAVEHRLELVSAACAAARVAEGATRALPEEPAAPDASVLEAARTVAAAARDDLVRTESLLHSAELELSRARQLAERSARLSGEEDCPVCGQHLGDAFESVQAHRQGELTEAEQRIAPLTAQLRKAKSSAAKADSSLAAATSADEAARAARAAWELADRRCADAVGALTTAWASVRKASPDGPLEAPPAAELESASALLKEQRDRMRACAAETERIKGRLERRPAAEAELAASVLRHDQVVKEVEALRDQVRSLGFDPARLQAAREASDAAAGASREATRHAQDARVKAAEERRDAEAAAARLTLAREQHERLSDLESDSRHLSRTADLLGEFRNTLVASVGPRLAVQAGDLFGELTDHEYEDVRVDPETFQLQISDGGVLYDLDRFSGSEVDLANLALRVAISEHIHFQSGGSVGLLVLDEVFGPLDEDRKSRMLLALERLRARFRQVLVVTHDSEIKEKLPLAIQVTPLPGRRATAELL